MKKKTFTVIAVISGFWFMFSSPLLARQVASADEEKMVIPRLSSSPKIDGLLDEVYEQQALKIENFVQLSPQENGQPGEKTVAYLGYDQKNLYLAFRCFDSQPKKIRCSVTSRDNCMEDDWVIIFLDTFGEKRRAFTFVLNPIGVQADFTRVEEGGSDYMDDSWDTFFLSNGKMDDLGYVVEAAIPFKSIRFPDEDPKTWNIVLGRNLPRTGEIIIWPRYSRTIPGLLSQGKPFILTGNLEKGKNLELMPVITSAKTGGQKIDVQPGLNLKYGANSDLTFDLTANPDFSQVEADVPQIDLNLRYALYYQEKRPFFLEGMEIFRYPAIEMVYTRRIIDPLFGARITGKTGRFSYGLLTAYDQKPTESLWDVSNGGGRETTDRQALFNIFRVKADVFDQSYVGFTLADKEITGKAWNRVAGIDGMWRFKDRVFFSFQALASDTRNEERNTSLAPAIYSEFYYYTPLRKKLHWGAGGYFQAMHPDFEASSGFVNRVDYRLTGLFTFFNLFTEKKYLNQVDLNLQVAQRDSYRGDLVQDKWFSARLQFRLTEFNRIFINLTRSMERYAEIDFNKTTFYLEGQTTFLSWLPVNFYFQTGDSINYDPQDPFLGYSNIFGLFLTLKPEKRLQLGLDINWQRYWREWGGEKLWDYLVIRQKTTFQISKTLSIRTIVDYNDYYKKIFGSLLLSWVLRPGTLFYLGADSNYLRDDFGHYARSNYGVFMKFSYWWRI